MITPGRPGRAAEVPPIAVSIAIRRRSLCSQRPNARAHPGVSADSAIKRRRLIKDAMPADGMSAAAEKTGFRRPRRRLVDKTTPAAPGLKGAHDVSYWPKDPMQAQRAESCTS